MLCLFVYYTWVCFVLVGEIAIPTAYMPKRTYLSDNYQKTPFYPCRLDYAKNQLACYRNRYDDIRDTVPAFREMFLDPIQMAELNISGITFANNSKALVEAHF